MLKLVRVAVRASESLSGKSPGFGESGLPGRITRLIVRDRGPGKIFRGNFSGPQRPGRISPVELAPRWNNPNNCPRIALARLARIFFTRVRASGFGVRGIYTYIYIYIHTYTHICAFHYRFWARFFVPIE